MKIRRHLIVVCLCCGCIVEALGQAHEHGAPASFTENLPEITHFYDLPPVDSASCGNREVLAQFACPILTNFHPDNSGEWVETPRASVWRLGVRSQNAYSLYMTMQYQVSPGVRVFVYAPGYRDLRGAFTHKNNNPSEVLTIAPVRGDKLVIEVNAPPSQDSPGKIKVTKAFHDFRNIFGESAENGRLPSSTDECSQDINCANGSYWQTEKRAVCKIISNGGVGTGTLVGNTSGSDEALVLTAHHLISSAEIAAEAVFLFNYETTGCGEELSTSFGSLSGAKLLATTDRRVDFTLMKLYETPPPSYRVFYAGWDARNINPEKGVCIHHPFGASKEIAIEYHPVVSEDIGEGYDKNSTWKVSHWELGTTELGSSGAPLFNERHRVAGILTGGRSTCGYPRDDYFAKVGVSWNAYPDPSNQLKRWLDPAQTGRLVLDGYDPYGFNAAHCDTAWNLFASDALEVSAAGFSWGTVSGHSSAGYTQFAERFEPAGVLHINGAYLNVAKAYASHPLAHIELKVWEGDGYPEKELYSQLLFIEDLQPDKINYIAFDTALKRSEPFFVGYTIAYDRDTFALYHAADRGIRQPSSMYVYDGEWRESKEAGGPGIAASLALGISACYGTSNPPAPDRLRVYPNPAKNSATLDVPGRLPVHEVKCFDSSGRAVPVTLRQTEHDASVHFNLTPGIYYLKIVTAEKPFAARLIVLQE